MNKTKDLHAWMIDSLAEMRAAMPHYPLEWAVRDPKQLVAELGYGSVKDGVWLKIEGVQVMRDESVRPGRVWLRVAWGGTVGAPPPPSLD